MNLIPVFRFCYRPDYHLLVLFGRKPARHNNFKLFVVRSCSGRNESGVVPVGNNVKFALIAVVGKLLRDKGSGAVYAVELFVKSAP